MNIHNNENDPFEDVFKDRFADFESEPDTQLWQKIEPKLPVNPTRKFPYWQTSAVVVLLLLAGLWNYHNTYSDDVIVKSNNTKVNNTTPLLSVSSQATEGIDKPVLLEKAIENAKLSVRTQTTTNSNKKSPLLSVSSQTTKEELTVTNINKKSLPFSYPNTTIDVPQTSINETIEKSSVNNFSKNKNITLNLSSFDNSNEKQAIIADNLSNKVSISEVFSSKESISGLSKSFLISLDSKSYNLLKNHFKTPKLKFILTPKKDDYFKESKPMSLYVSVMPLLNYYTITPNGNNANYIHSISVNNDDDRLGFYTQAGLVFTLSDRFKLRTGLTFTKTNHSINYQIRTDSLIIQPSDKQGVDVSFEEKKANYSQVANYLGTKIEVQYIFLEGEALTHYLNVGLEGAYKLNGVNQFNGFANFAYGITRRIGDNAYLFVEPTFSYSLNQQNENNSFLLVKPNKIGFNIGVNFKIK